MLVCGGGTGVLKGKEIEVKAVVTGGMGVNEDVEFTPSRFGGTGTNQADAA